MEKQDLVVQETMIADDFLIQVAEQAERRIDAVIKIKKVSLKVTNARDWTDQNGNPYLQVSGSEKIANLFNISWRIDEPIYEEEPGGHFTWTYKGYFSLGGRTIEAVGTRSSKDSFFNKYEYIKVEGQKDERKLLPISAIDKGDVKKAALTNLLGNGITRILGIRNLTWEDLKEFANITKEQVTTIQYKKHGEPLQEPQKKNGAPKTETLKTTSQILNVTQKDGVKSDKKTQYSIYSIFGLIDGKEIAFKTFDKEISDEALAGKKTGRLYEFEYVTGQYGNDLKSLTALDEPVGDQDAQ